MVLPSADLATAPDRAAWDVFVFRKSRDLLSTRALLQDLRAEVESGGSDPTDALVRAGEIETGLADADSTGAGHMARVVDQLAAMACGTSSASVVRSSVVASLEQFPVCPAHIRCAHPEGFSYYGLHPLDFADLVVRIHPSLKPRVAVIGIRSVGSTLGAVVCTALQRHGKNAERVTVRPQGEPYQRRTIFSPVQLRWIEDELRQRADFAIVDEGPGFSGSTFLSVARALLAAGVPESRIVLLCSRPFPAHLAGSDQAREWQRLRSHVIEYGRRIPRNAGRSLGGGAWREILVPNRSHWPACWTDQERIKYLSVDGKTFFKFEGFGRCGRRAQQQASELTQAGFSPRLAGFENGYGCYEFIPGHPLSLNGRSPALLERMAAYCAFRAACFPAEGAKSSVLSEMLRVNLRIEFGLVDFAFEVPQEHPVYPDCRMMPHEWLHGPQGHILKADSVGHGDGHQLPGPADIAWDLAGTIVEWKLPSAAAEFFIRSYHRLSGDDPGRRMPAYLQLYSVLRMAQCRLAAQGMVGTQDAALFINKYLHLRSIVKAMLNINTLASTGVQQLQ